MMRSLLRRSIAKLIGSHKAERIALNFSGGTDSTCLLLACLDLGIKPKLYIYSLKGYISPDLKKAQKIARHYSLGLELAWIPNTIDSLKRDTLNLINNGYRGKVSIQCIHGHYYIAPMVKEQVILNGSGVDGLYGSYRAMILSNARVDKGSFDIQRKKHLDNPNDDSMLYQHKCYAKYQTDVLFPYRVVEIVDYLMDKSWVEINRPRLKWIIVKDFPEITELKVYRSRGSQQIMAGVRAFHEQLLTSDFNRHNRKRVTEIYKDLELEFGKLRKGEKTWLKSSMLNS